MIASTQNATTTGIKTRIFKNGTNNNTINNYTINSVIQLSKRGDYVKWWNTGTTLSKNMTDYDQFSLSGKFDAYGNCSSMVNTTGSNDIPTTFAFFRLFYNCTTLETAPALPASGLTSSCYRAMFQNSTSLKKPPKLPATTTPSFCYSYMFCNCSNLQYTPELPTSGTINERSYQYMFNGCNKIKFPADLPGTTLNQYCYYAMYNSCTNMEESPELPATTLGAGSYGYLFYNCSKLKEIKVNFTSWGSPAENTSGWVSGSISSSGYFFSPMNLSESHDGDHVPVGWTKYEDALLFKAAQANSTVKFGSSGGKIKNGIQYRRTGNLTWQTYTPGTTITLTNIGDGVYFRGIYNTWNNDSSRSTSEDKFFMTGLINAYRKYHGNVKLSKRCLYLVFPFII